MAYNRLEQIASNIAPRSSSGTANTTSLAELIKGLSTSGGQNLPDAVSQATRQMGELTGVNNTHAELLAANTQAITQNTAGQSGKGVAGAVGNFASSFLGNALSFLPLVSGLLKLFGGGGNSQPAALVSYLAPQPLNVNEANGSGAAVYDQYGVPRTAASSPQNLISLSAPGSPPAGNGSAAAQSGGDAAGGAAPAAQTPPTNITVQVNAMDSRSFLDHSHEIAQAVRDAMLNMHSLNDVVNDL